MKSNPIEDVAVRLCEVYGCTRESIERLIELTNGVNGVSFVSMKSYNSDASNNTEVADQLINVGASYDNMLKKDAEILSEVDITKIDVDAFNYQTIDFVSQGLTLEQYKEAVRGELQVALDEMRSPKENNRVNNDVYLNKALVFNTNTLRLSVMGQSLSKTVTEKGELKVVKSAPKTVAKKLIQKQVEMRSAKIRRFAVDNLRGMNLKGDTLEIGGGKEPQVYTAQNTGVKVIIVDEKKKTVRKAKG